MAFNSLNQMSGFYLRLSHSDYKLLIQGEKVNPIQISVAGDVTGLPIQIARQLPGPVEMFIQPDGGASLRYRILPNFEGRIGSLVQRGALIDSMQLSTKEVDGFEEEDLQQACEDHGKGIARLDDAYAAFMSTVQRLRGAIP
ncbi:MAG: hypothetical protein KDD60_12815, partial [Bdellovibrionales bacterium]|nr:hypothetical protein [Bdellovibrionales bacterium]